MKVEKYKIKKIIKAQELWIKANCWEKSEMKQQNL